MDRQGGGDANLGPRLDAPSETWSESSSGVPDADGPSYERAESQPVEDSYYPDQGDPGVDTLHYDLDLTWDPDTSTLTGVAEITLRATEDADRVQLDLLDALGVERVIVDGADVVFSQEHNHLVVEQPVAADERYTLQVSYAGTPAPVPAPTTRRDLPSLGMNVTSTGQLWTMQEPFGAFTWYPVNDQPSDKAYYDFTVRVPQEWVGVANGELESRTVEDGHTVTTWHLSHPASSYLTTLAVGDFVETKDVSASGVPISYWTPRGDSRALRAVRRAPEILTWNEQHLGPYPFDSLGFLIVDSDSGMETQTMITLGNTAYARSAPVIQHEMAHHWYGDVVSPTDWRDVWMNEGMATFLQGAYEADGEGISIDAMLDTWVDRERQARLESGPPGAYDAGEFGSGNVYVGPALMWNELRHNVGDAEFWRLVKEWPTVHADGNATREQYFDWIEAETGHELSAFLDDWIMGATTPS
jgi:aminopeptidase N